MRRSTNAGEHPANETDADRRRNEQEFEEAERYQAELREQEHRPGPPLPREVALQSGPRYAQGR